MPITVVVQYSTEFSWNSRLHPWKSEFYFSALFVLGESFTQWQLGQQMHINTALFLSFSVY